MRFSGAAHKIITNLREYAGGNEKLVSRAIDICLKRNNGTALEIDVVKMVIDEIRKEYT